MNLTFGKVRFQIRKSLIASKLGGVLGRAAVFCSKIRMHQPERIRTVTDKSTQALAETLRRELEKIDPAMPAGPELLEEATKAISEALSAGGTAALKEFMESREAEAKAKKKPRCR